MTRRELALALAAAPVTLAQQNPPPPAVDPEAAAKQQVLRTREQLRKFKVPITTEPSFAFRP
jgi:hypothetical protein